MNKLPAIPFFVDDYLADTAELTLEEHGAYLLLLFAMWRRGGTIPDSDDDNARLLRISLRHWRSKIKPRLMPLLTTYGGTGNAPAIGQVLTQKRLQKSWNYAVQNRANQSAKGKRGAKERWERYQLLKSIPGIAQVNDTGIATGRSKGNGPGNGTGYDRPIASKKERYTTTTSTVSENPEAASIERLLNTRLMRQ